MLVRVPVHLPHMSDGRARPKVSTRTGNVGSADEPDPETVLSALEDGKCRAILRTVSEEWLTAPELAERCELSSSTVYRKVDRLVEAGLLEQSVRIAGDTKPADQYRCAVDRVELDLGRDEVDVDVVWK